MKKRIMRKLHKLSCDWSKNSYNTADGLHVLIGRLTKKQEWLLGKKHRREYIRFLCRTRRENETDD